MYKIFVGGISVEGERLLKKYLNKFVVDYDIEPITPRSCRATIRTRAGSSDVMLVIIEESIYSRCEGVCDEQLALPKVHKYTSDELLEEFLITKFGKINDNTVKTPDEIIGHNIEEDAYIPKTVFKNSEDSVPPDKLPDGVVHYVQEDSYDNLAISSSEDEEDKDTLITKLKADLSKSEMMVRNLTLQLKDGGDSDASYYIDKIKELEGQLKEAQEKLSDNDENNYVQLGKIARAEEVIKQFNDLNAKLRTEKNNRADYIHKLEVANETIKKLNDAISDRDTELEELHGLMSEKEESIVSLNSRVQSLTSDLTTATADNTVLQGSVEKNTELNAQIEVLKKEISDKKLELDNLSADIKNLNTQIEGYSTQIENFTENEKGYLKKIEELEAEIKDLRSNSSDEVTKLKGDIDKKSGDITNLTKRVNTLTSDISLKDSTISTLTSDLTEANETIASKDAELTTIRTDLSDKEELLSQANAKLTSIKTELSNKEALLNQANTDLAAKDAELKSVSDELTKLQESSAENDSNNSTEIEKYKTQVTSLNDKIKSLNDDIAKKTSDYTNLSNDLITKEDELAIKTTALETAIKERDKNMESYIKSEEDKIALNDKIKSLSSDLANAKTEATDLRTELTNARTELTKTENKLKQANEDLVACKADSDTIDRLEKDLLTERRNSAKLTSELEVLKMSSNSDTVAQLRLEIARLKSESSSDSGVDTKELDELKKELTETRARCTNLELELVEKSEQLNEASDGVFSKIANFAMPKVAYDINVTKPENLGSNFMCVASGSTESASLAYQTLRSACEAVPNKHILIVDLVTDSCIDKDFRITQVQSPIDWLKGSEPFNKFIAGTNLPNVRVLSTALAFLNDLFLLQVDWQARLSELSNFADVIIINIGCLNNLVSKVLFNTFNSIMRTRIITKATPVNLRTVMLTMAGFVNVSNNVIVECINYNDRSKTMYKRLTERYKAEILKDTDVLKL